MKKTKEFTVFLFLSGLTVLIIISCHKDITKYIGSVPVANAGSNDTLTLPNNIAVLDGKGSFDPDGTIVKYFWSKISGPSSFFVENTGAALTKVSNLVEGEYIFRLTVTDNSNNSSITDKQIIVNPIPSIPVGSSFTEEFDSVYNLETKGWVIKNSSSGGWVQGNYGCDKSGVCHGFPALSYTVSPDEYVYAFSTAPQISSWLITPVISIKNGDEISFYTRTDSGSHADRMQVLMNKSSSADVGTSGNSVGSFTTTLFDINDGLTGYPETWTKYVFTFSGISGKLNTRIGFRYVMPNSFGGKGIGVDLFKFKSN
jgi:hypothetical protein